MAKKSFLKQYQDFCRESNYCPPHLNAMHLIAGISAEAGEVAEVVQKSFRAGSTELNGDSILLELGDLLWHISELARALDYDLESVMQLNINKIKHRQKNESSTD